MLIRLSKTSVKENSNPVITNLNKMTVFKTLRMIKLVGRQKTYKQKTNINKNENDHNKSTCKFDYITRVDVGLRC